MSGYGPMRLSKLIAFCSKYLDISKDDLCYPMGQRYRREQRIATCACIYLTNYSRVDVASAFGYSGAWGYKSVAVRVYRMTPHDYTRLVDLIQAWRNRDSSRV